MITVAVNKDDQQVDEGTTVVSLLTLNQIQETRGVAVAVNNQVIPKSNWNSFALKQGDAVTIISATAGG